MDLVSKLQVRPGQRIAIINAPASITPDLPQATTDDAMGADVVLAFVATRDEISTVAVLRYLPRRGTDWPGSPIRRQANWGPI